MIPEKSEASIKKGNWFIHKDGDNTIQVWSSNVHGKEKVFLNNNLVSEHRSIKMKSAHQFQSADGANYEVRFRMESLSNGSLECVMERDGTRIKTFKTKYIKGKNFSLKRAFVLLLACIGYSTLGLMFDIPDFFSVVFVAILMLAHFLTRDHGEFLIEEIE